MGINFKQTKLTAETAKLSKAATLGDKSGIVGGKTTAPAVDMATRRRSETGENDHNIGNYTFETVWEMDKNGNLTFCAMYESREVCDRNGNVTGTTTDVTRVKSTRPSSSDTGKIETKISAETIQAQQNLAKIKLPNAKKV